MTSLQYPLIPGYVLCHIIMQYQKISPLADLDQRALFLFRLALSYELETIGHCKVKSF